MGNFDINTNFNMFQSINNLNNFNNVFSEALSKEFIQSPNITNGVDFNSDFATVFNQIGQNQDVENVKNANKTEISPSQKMANDIMGGFKDGIENLNKVTKQAQDDIETFAMGGDISIHEVMISAEKSSLAMQMALQLRSQILNAYNEFKNMQL